MGFGGIILILGFASTEGGDVMVEEALVDGVVADDGFFSDGLFLALATNRR
jgi:hypothetical protein